MSRAAWRNGYRLASQRFGRWSWVLGLLTLTCGGQEPRAPVSVEDLWGDVFSWHSQLTVAENREVVTVGPLVRPDPWGGYLVADQAESQLRRYDEDGVLLWYAGGPGEGVLEFRGLRSGCRLPSGEILAADRHGKITVLDSVGGAVRLTSFTSFRRLGDIEVLNDSLLIVSAMLPGELDGPRLHLWNLRSDSILVSFFQPTATTPDKDASTVAGWTQMALHGDTMAAVFALSDTVYLFRVDGTPLDRVPVPSRHFRSITDHAGRRTQSTLTIPAERAEWFSSFDLMADVQWLPDGTITVSYQEVLPRQALSRRWHLVRMTVDGRRVFELRDVPRLLTVDIQTGRFLFASPFAKAPNEWSIAELKR